MLFLFLSETQPYHTNVKLLEHHMSFNQACNQLWNSPPVSTLTTSHNAFLDVT